MNEHESPINPTTLCREFNLVWKPSTGAERCTWEQMPEILWKTYWRNRNRLLPKQEKQSA